jgi:hypothetical protein
MSSFTEELLGKRFREVKTGTEELILKLDVAKLEVPISAIKGAVFVSFEKRINSEAK